MDSSDLGVQGNAYYPTILERAEIVIPPGPHKVTVAADTSGSTKNNSLIYSNDLCQRQPAIAQELYQLLIDCLDQVEADLPTANPDFDPIRRAEWGRHPSR